MICQDFSVECISFFFFFPSIFLGLFFFPLAVAVAILKLILKQTLMHQQRVIKVLEEKGNAFVIASTHLLLARCG